METRPGYKLTEIGVIPEGWDVVPMRNLFAFRNGVNADKAAYGRGTPFINVLEIITHSTLTEARIPGRVSLPEQVISAFRVQTGDVLFNRTSETQEEVGLASVYTGRGEVVFGGFVIRARPQESRLDPIFSSYSLRSATVRHQIISRGQGFVHANLGQQELSKVQVPVPPLAEQAAIAHALSDASATFESLEQLIAKKRRLKQGASQDLLTGKRRLPTFATRNATYQTRFGLIPEDWRPKSLAEVAAFITKGATPTTYGFTWRDTGVLFLRSECVSERGLDLSQSMFIAPEAHRMLRRSEVRPGDILMTITGNVGRVAYLGNGFGEANINQHIARIRIANEDVAAPFVFHFLSQPVVRRYYSLITTGQAYPQISLKQVRETEIPMPTLAEQTAIANILSDMDSEIAALEAKLAKVRRIKQGMIQNLLTGRIRLV